MSYYNIMTYFLQTKECNNYTASVNIPLTTFPANFDVYVRGMIARDYMKTRGHACDIKITVINNNGNYVVNTCSCLDCGIETLGSVNFSATCDTLTITVVETLDPPHLANWVIRVE